MARRLGAKDEWLLALRRETHEENTTGTGTEDGLDAAWAASLRYAEAVTDNGHAVSDSDYETLSEYWNEGEIIEITMVIGLFNYFNRVNDALRIDITK